MTQKLTEQFFRVFRVGCGSVYDALEDEVSERRCPTCHHGHRANEVFLIDLATGNRKLFHTYTLADTAGLVDTAPPTLSADLKSYVYSYTRITSDLYVVEGLR